MFRIGEFSKIAQVSGRLLRYYDEIELLNPIRIDEWTGYRYYSATQLPRLNRILALKDLGLTLDQIARLLDENISAEEIRGMLTMKRAQIEQTLQEDLLRFRFIESRIEQIDAEGQMQDFDIVLKSIPARKFLSMREVCTSLDHVLERMFEITRLLPAKVGQKSLGSFAAIMHSDMYEPEILDLEMGYYLNDDLGSAISLSDGSAMTVRELLPVELMATVVRVGDPAKRPTYCAALGTWIESQGYRLMGPSRELFLQMPQPGRFDEAVIEMQYPVEKVQSDIQLLS